ncbi:MAG: hypothetical protein ACJATU_001077 [Rickettsiales bacterium]|jgi:hypothetical protein
MNLPTHFEKEPKIKKPNQFVSHVINIEQEGLIIINKFSFKKCLMGEDRSRFLKGRFLK